MPSEPLFIHFTDINSPSERTLILPVLDIHEGDEVRILGWPPEHEGEIFAEVTRVLHEYEYDGGRTRSLIVKLLVGTTYFQVGEEHQFPVEMLELVEGWQARVV